ncbi:MAG TPA: porin [Acidobacteriaceae bacterium]|nr:porin [Acidobacteriaceae bacterium]
MTSKRVLHSMTGIFLGCVLSAGAQAQTTPAPTPPPPPAAAPAAPTWSVGALDFSGFIDGYYGYNANRPSNAANGQVNDLYNFNDKTDQFNLSAADLTINHTPDPIGVHIDLIFGRTNVIIHSSSDKSTDNYIEQAYISATPPKTHGSEFDFGQFVTSAGAEVIPAMSNWNYSRSLLFAWAIPYYHFGLRTSTPFTKTWTAGVQVVNGWNNVNANNGGVTIGLTSAYVKPKYTWDLNYYTGPSNSDTQKGYRNLIDTTILLTPSAKFNAYLNYDYGQNHTPATTSTTFPYTIAAQSPHWQGIAVAAHDQFTAKQAVTGRFEYFDDNQGFSTGDRQAIKEFTATYEYKWMSGLLTRAEYRRDWSTFDYFHKGDTGMVGAQSTLTVAFIAFFGPKR